MTRLEQALRWWRGSRYGKGKNRLYIYYRDIPQRHFGELVKAGYLEKSKFDPEVFYLVRNLGRLG